LDAAAAPANTVAVQCHSKLLSSWLLRPKRMTTGDSSVSESLPEINSQLKRLAQTIACNNYLFDKKKGKLFFTGFFSSAKTALFSTRTKKQWKKVFSFFEHGVLFL
jgi:hypothetical protein